MKQGCIHIYCGEGKGKTTASLGLALRAAGSGMKVIIVQFLKGRETSELNSLKRLPNIKVIRNTKDFGFFRSLAEEEIQEITDMHTKNLKSAIDKVESGTCDLLILDELCAAYENSLIDKKIVRDMIVNKPEQLELVITGRNPDNLFIEHADYISEVKKIRHPYDKNISARKGIEF